MKGFYIVAFLLLLLNVNAQNKKLVIIGSSTSACTGPSSFSNCYVARLDAYYDGIGQPIDIVQLAVGGYNVYKGMPSSYVGPSGGDYQPDPNNNITKALTLNPDVILVNYPTNAFNVLGIDSIMHAFRTIRDSGNKAGVPVFITTSQPRHAAPDFDDPAERAKLKEVRDSVILEFGSFAINFFDGLADATYQILPAYDAGDHIHLNDAGHDILFQRVRDANIFAATLPVKLRAFNASQRQSQVIINWSVTDELPGTRYEVQRSTDGSSFQSFYTVTSANAAAARSYQATDPGAASGAYYYRLKVVEDARTFFSPVVKLFVTKNKLSFKSISVDPLNHQLVMKLNAAEMVRVQFSFVNSTGQIVQKNMQVLQPGENRLSFALNSLPAGTYWAEANAGQQKIFTKGFRVY